MQQFQNSAAYAQDQDKNDSLAKYRDQFLFPTFTKEPAIYFTGNSLGLQPKSMQSYIQTQLDEWHKFGVRATSWPKSLGSHFTEELGEKASKVVGAKPSEVVITHSLTTNLHLLMVSFYRPQGKKNEDYL